MSTLPRFHFTTMNIQKRSWSGDEHTEGSSNQCAPLHLSNPFSLREKDWVREFLQLFSSHPTLSRRRGGSNTVHYLPVGSAKCGSQPLPAWRVEVKADTLTASGNIPRRRRNAPFAPAPAQPGFRPSKSSCSRSSHRFPNAHTRNRPGRPCFSGSHIGQTA